MLKIHEASRKTTRPAAKRTYWGHWTKCPRCGGQFVHKDRPCFACFPCCPPDRLPAAAVSHTYHFMHWLANTPKNPHLAEFFAAHPELAAKFEAAAGAVQIVARDLSRELATAVNG